MSKTTQLSALLENRKNLYDFLSRVYLLEVDAPQLAAMKEMTFPADAGTEGLTAGYRLLEAFLKSADERVLDDLAVDYARVFLSAGVAQGLAAFPYQSIYTGDQRLMAQLPAVELTAIYASKKLKALEKGYRVPNDHLGLELAFMAHLCVQAGEALKKNDKAGFTEAMSEQKNFLDKYLLSWIGGFCRDLAKYAETDFYKAIAKTTSGFLALENQLIGKGDESWDID